MTVPFTDIPQPHTKRGHFFAAPHCRSPPLQARRLSGARVCVCVVVAVAAWLCLGGGLHDTATAPSLTLRRQSFVRGAQPALSPPHRPRLADGCTHVYIDLGSNLGVQVRKLYEPAKFPGAPALQMFDDHFGPSPARNGAVCAFGFEANPKHAPRLRALEACYNSRHWRTTFFAPAAVSTRTGPLELQFEDGSEYEYWGASVVAGAKGPNGLSQSVMVPAVALSRFILDEVVGRSLPHHDATTGVVPRVLMKMDIEGSEYEVLPELMSTGALCHVDTVVLEWHPEVASNNAVAAMEPVLRWLDGAVTAHDGSTTRCVAPTVSAVDDESYLHDGQAAPIGANCTSIPNTTRRRG